MALLSSDLRVAYLHAMGFRGSFAVMLGNFQRGWNLGTALTVDRLYGPASDAALRRSYANLRAGRGTASAHFGFQEFRCKCYGRNSVCEGVKVHRGHLQRLEQARTRVGSVSIISGYRDPVYNRAVGGASNSQHLYGVASDVSFPSITTVRGWRLFAGIGYGGVSRRVKHVDSRDLGGKNTTGGRPAAPTQWVYSAW